MKHAHSFCLFFSLSTAFLFSQSNLVPEINQSAVSASQTAPKAQSTILDDYGKLPLSFEANRGQTASHVKFLSRTSSFMLFLTGDEAVFALNGRQTDTWKEKIARVSRTSPSGTIYPKAGGVLRMKLRNANPAAKVRGLDELAGRSNYFIGNDPKKWSARVPTFTRVKYEEIYSGIDLVYYGNQRQLEYDFIVAPGADPRRIAFAVSGAKRIRRDAQGGLVFEVGEEEVRWHQPLVYQEKNGARREIAANYVITNTNRVGFELGKYDAGMPLYIDPLMYSTYLGGSGWEDGIRIAVDSAGNAYVTGATYSTDFPVTAGAYQTICDDGYDCGSNGDVFVAKLNPAGSALIYSTYLGGNGQDFGNGIAVDGEGNAYVAGFTLSTDFPTMNPLQPKCGGGNPNCEDSFVTKLNATGSALVYSTYLGGSGNDEAEGIALDSAGNAYISGGTTSIDFPTRNPLQSANGGGANGADAFVAKINGSGSALIYSTYLGGNGDDFGQRVAVDDSGNSYVIGQTSSSNFPTSNPLQPTYGGGNSDAFIAKLNSSGSALIYSTFIGGSDVDVAYGVAVDSAGSAYITGSTGSNNFPITVGAFQTVCGGGNNCATWAADAFIAKLNPTGSTLVYSTFLGGSKFDEGNDIAVDSTGCAYVVGSTSSGDFPTTNGIQRKHAKYDAFVSKFNATGSALVYSTYLGGNNNDYGYGIAIDAAGNTYVTGSTLSNDFPTMNPLQPVFGGKRDAFVAKLNIAADTTTTVLSSPNPSSHGQTVTFVAVVTSAVGAPPDGENVSFMKGKTVLGTGTLSRGSATFTTSTLKVGTNSITAVYGGDSNFAGSKSKAVKQVVEKAVE
jgi:Bacterial Ig-like domain (group 3)/Beta-propeller repeat